MRNVSALEETRYARSTADVLTMDASYNFLVVGAAPETVVPNNVLVILLLGNVIHKPVGIAIVVSIHSPNRFEHLSPFSPGRRM